MYWSASSNSVRGDGDGAWDVVGAGLLLLVVLGAEPLHAAKSNAIKSNISRIGLIGPIVLILRQSETLIYLFIPNVHDRTLCVFVNNIKPAARSRMIKKVVMTIV